jgi:hypothetical protein
MKLAQVSITDDKEDTLKNIAKNNPWHMEAMKIIVGGSEEEALEPLSTILSKHFDLTLDAVIDVTGMSKGGHALDTQGYIAHNDETIVVAYRCALNVVDWLCNLSFTTSACNLEKDMERGHSGYCSCLFGRKSYVRNKKVEPRAHTGFYNNWLVSLPLIQEHVEPLLLNGKPRKLFVCGHSLGGGLATVAACYFLLNYDWASSNNKLVIVTAGAPRAVNDTMKNLVDEKMAVYRPLDKAVICRVVNYSDIVPSLPPESLQFQHLDKLVYITKDGEVLINPDKKYSIPNMSTLKEISTLKGIEGDAEESSDYEKLAAKVPRGMSDHQPDMYLNPLIALVEKDQAAYQQTSSTISK